MQCPDTADPKSAGRRFQFGRNWHDFLSTVDERRIREAERHLQRLLSLERLDGLGFLDVGCGSGLMSLAASRLGAGVRSFDVDEDAVRCALELKRRHGTGRSDWVISRGSILDRTFLESLGSFDIVYSWGVLHHTGAMWHAIDNVTIPVAAGGRLAIAIYNDQGNASERWLRVKETYNRLPVPLRSAYVIWIMGKEELDFAWNPRLLLRPRSYYHQWHRYVGSWRNYYRSRGMSRWHDMVDWVGGYPFEVARPDRVESFLSNLGFSLEAGHLTEGPGNNEFVFRNRRSDS